MKFLFEHPHIGAFFVAWFLADILTPVMQYLSFKLNVLDHPHARKIHTEPIPRLGGAAIFLACTLSILSTLDYTKALLAVVVAGGCITFMGLADDFFSIPATVKFVFLFAVILVLAFGFDVHLRVPFENIVINILITAVWMVYVMSCFNGIDNMDGQAGGVTYICGMAFYLISYGTDQSAMGYLAICLAGSCFGFLRYNSNPASIFMGDSGAFFIGFMIASMAIMGEWAGHDEPLKAVTIPLLVLAFPMFDLFYTTLMRYKSKKVKTFKEAILMSAKDHTSHRLQSRFSLTHRETVLACYLLAAIPSALAVLASVFAHAFAALFLFGTLAMFTGVGIVLAKAELTYAENDSVT